MKTLEEKQASLMRWLAEAGSVAVAFSGGVDSTLFLDVAHDVLGDAAVAVTVASPFMPAAEQTETAAFCADRGIELVTVQADPLADEAIRANTPERCYLCKRALFSRVQDAAAQAGCAVVADGSNADDADDFRPGMRALRELGIASPLLEVGLTKDDIRVWSRERGLATADKPSQACLATRIPYGTPLDDQTLARIEAAEDVLHGLGFAQVRVRDHGDVARIEVESDEVERLAAADVRRIVDERLRGLGYAYVAADLAGFRSGSMNHGMTTNGADHGR